MAMESVLRCLVRDSQALGRGFLHIKQQSQVALGTSPCLFVVSSNFLIVIFSYVDVSRTIGITGWSHAEHST